MNDTTDLLEMISFPYYAHLQAQLTNAIHSISWNKVALLGYVDILLYAKDQLPPAGFQRKIRMLYENYENLGKNYPVLGDLDGLFRGLNRLDKDHSEQVATTAIQWHNTVQVLEKICLNMTARRLNYNDPSQLSEALQRALYQLHQSSVLPKLQDFLDEEQEEIRRLAQLKKYPITIFQKLKLRNQFGGTFHTDKEPVQFLIEKDSELQDLINIISKTFFRLVNLVNQKLPEPDRSLKAKQTNQDLSTPRDYRLVVNLAYDGNDENEYEAGLFSKLRNLIRVT
ncbi:MAG: hypothetical protein ACM3YE_01975 [Bacteroidota bacterium]